VAASLAMNKKYRPVRYLILLAGVIIFCSCQPAQSEIAKEAEMSISLSSAAFTEAGMIPQKYTCDGENISPPLNWTEISQNAKSLVLIVDDPDAPAGIFVHWVLYNVDASLRGLPEDVAKSASVSGIGLQGVNDFRRSGYDGPCPPKGSPHRYYFKLYALDTMLSLKAGASKSEVENAMQGHILAQGQLMGKYSRK